jgi:protein-disulfide isomerase
MSSSWLSRNWKFMIPAALFFLLGIFLLLYAFVLAPDSKVTKAETERAEKIFLGIPQKGSVLGEGEKKDKVIVFADLQCFFCAEFSKKGLPHLVEKVRKGELKLDLRILSLLGPDSIKAAEAAQALAPQNKMWQFTELFYLNQEAQGSGYVNDAFINQIYQALAVDEKLADASREKAKERVALDDELAFRSGIRGTPAFLFVSKNNKIEPLVFRDFTKEGINKALADVRD